jgi:Asp-tRNA(Asn)/Glu-tRNA(Gln) amidotransferase A subunit family amidase
MHELGTGSTGNVSVYGAARNPWDTERCPGGSSSGPAAAVAARLVPGAVGADGLGSVRFPAAYCGLTGLKPTFGRSAMAGHHMEAVTTLIVSGPLCADAADCRLLGSALFGEDLAAGDAAGLRIGVVRDVVSEDVAPEVGEACEAAIEALCAETGGEVRTVELADLEAANLAAILTINGESLSGVTPQRLRLAALFEDVDVIAWPTIPATAPPLESPMVELPSGTHTADQANVRGAALANLTGIPAISVPVGIGSGELPIALQLQAAWGRDELLLDAAEALERANGRRWVESLPPLAQAEPTEA